MAAAGAKVILAARDAAKLEAAAAEIPESIWVVIDMASQESIKAAFAKAGKAMDILVNNAAITRDGLALRMKKRKTIGTPCWQQPISRARLWPFPTSAATNDEGAVGPHHQHQFPIVGETGNPGQANYVASKAGLIGMTKSLAQEMASRNITVNAVAPGFIATDMTAGLADELKNNMLAHIPLKRFGTPGRTLPPRSVSGERGSGLHHGSSS